MARADLKACSRLCHLPRWENLEVLARKASLLPLEKVAAKSGAKRASRGRKASAGCTGRSG